MRIRGAFPGGPRRRDPAAPPTPPPYLPSVESLEARAESRREERRWKRRALRRALGAAAVFATALAIGGLLGRASRVTAHDELAGRGSPPSLDRVISREVNRTLLELWKMENLEAVNVGRSRR